MARRSPFFPLIGLAGVLVAALMLLWPVNAPFGTACGSVVFPTDPTDPGNVSENVAAWIDADYESACSPRHREVWTLAGGVATASIIFAVVGHLLVARRTPADTP